MSLLPVLRAEMSRISKPSSSTKVYKDECVYSFDNVYSSTGLYLNLLTMHGVGERYLAQDAQRTGAKLYLHQKWHKVPKEQEESATPNKLAIGLEGGFDSTKHDIIKEHALIVYGPEVHRIALPSSEIPEFLSNILNACIEHEGMAANLQANTWDGHEPKIISKYAENLPQLNPDNKRIPQDPKFWKDEASDATDNLWLNLSTGYIGGGRKNWDGSGGSGSALQHYLDTGKKYPLVVKLGTITPHGADVYSYAEDEDCMVIDPHLADHLSFWKIDIMKLEKTEKTVSELEVQLNMSYDWTKIMEGQEQLELLSGPGLLGFRNIGSSCYMNSAMQVFLSIPEVSKYLIICNQ
jgi:ubiquitin carboxyl-terminal hydrolase 5/13